MEAFNVLWFDVPKLGFPVELTTEGKARIWVPKREKALPSRLPVFYNPVMELNRDFAVLALQTFQRLAGREVDVCEPLAGCGVRGIRLALEIEGIKQVFLNDINEKATQLMRKNAEGNGVKKLVNVDNLDANLFLSQYAAPRKRFDYVDVDPFGSPVPYLDSAVRAVRDGGLIALTATDMAPLCGVHPRACVRKYGGKPLRTEYCHELAVRLLAGSLATTAARHDIGIRTVFCHSTDHYIRVYAVVGYGAQKADSCLKEMGYVLHCFNCFHRETIKGLFSPLAHECQKCHGKLNTAGPLWLGKIFDKGFITKMQKELPKKKMKQEKRISKLLFLTENEADAPATYYVIDKICDKYGLPAPSTENVIKQLEKAGYTAIPTHFHTRGIKTNMPAKIIKEIIMKEAGAY
jgi:tRNA (guanine26-N2/guanine27-N2)-dimethyltransferase